MRKLPLVALLYLLGTCHLVAQVQLGIGGAVNNTFYHKGQSEYSDDHVSRAMSTGIGLAVPVSFELSPSWHLRTGFGVHLKRYEVKIGNFMDVDDAVASFFYQVRFTCLELPAIVAFKTAKERKFKFEYRVGVVSSLYIPEDQSMGFNYNGATPLEGAITSTTPLSGTNYSPDLYVGIALLHLENGWMRQEFVASYQYGLLPMSGLDYTASLNTGGNVEVFTGVLKPTLSSFMLSYSFYPKWCWWGKEKESDE